MDTVTVDIDRTVHAPVETTRRTVISALTRLGFTIEQAQGMRVAAKRGSSVLGSVNPQKRPIQVDATVVGDDDSSTLHVHLAEGGQVVLDPRSASRGYAHLFAAINEELDGWLRALDPHVDARPLPAVKIAAGRVPGVKQMAGVAQRLGAEGMAERMRQEPWIWIMAPDAAAPMTMNDAQMCLAIASMVVADGRSLPPALRRQMEDVTLLLGRTIENATLPSARADVTAGQRKVVDLLYQQSLIRQGLPVREIHRCRDCTQEKVVNPDYQRRAKRNKRISDVMGMVGVSIGSNPQMFVLAGRLFNMKMLAPPTFLCVKCQGTDADISLATLCPQCHAIRRESLLTVCPTKGCGYDFRTRVAGRSPWQTLPAADEPATADSSAADASTADASTAAAPVAAVEQPATAPPGWYPDPSGRHRLRWFDTEWTAHVADDGGATEDPL